MKVRLTTEQIEKMQGDFLPQDYGPDRPLAPKPDARITIPFGYEGYTYWAHSSLTPGLVLKLLADWVDMRELLIELRDNPPLSSDCTSGLVEDFLGEKL